MLRRLLPPLATARSESRALARRRLNRIRPRIDHLEARIALSAPEPNDSFAQAYTPPDNIYLEQNYVNSDSVSTASDGNDFYKFYNLYGKSHLYASLLGLSSDADLYVYDQNQNLLAFSNLGGNASETINVDLPGNQYFYVRVAAFSGATNYSLFLYNDYAGSTLSTARDIGTAWGQSSDKFWPYNKIFSDDYLDYRDNVDIVKFAMEAPGTFSVRMKDFTYSGGLTAQMQLLDKDGNAMLTTSGTVGDGLNFDGVSLGIGTYYVKFTQLSGSDPYTFRINADYAGDTTATARNLGDVSNTSREEFDMVGGPFGLPTYEDATDLYKFTFSKTAPLDLRLQIAQGQTPPTFDASLGLAQDTNGDGLIEANEVLQQSANTGDDSISTTLSPGTYYVVVSQNGFYTSYQLDMDSDLDANPTDPAGFKSMSKAIDLGSLVGETDFNGGFGITPTDIADYYKFTMPVAGSVSVNVGNVNFFSRTQFTPNVAVIRDANGNRVNDVGETLVSGSGQVTINLAAGTYYFGVFSDGEQIDYFGEIFADFAGNTLNSARAMAPITVFNPPTQTFKDFIEQDFGAGSDTNDFYRFDLPATYQTTLSTSGLAGEDLSLSLIRDLNNNGVVDAGDVLVTSDTLNSPFESISRSLAAGRYFARVTGLNGFTNYTLSASFSASDGDDTIAEVQNLPSNTKALGTFADMSMVTRDDVDLFKITVVAGQRASFNVDALNGSSLDTYLRIFNSAGTQLAANDDGGPLNEAASKFSYLEYTFSQAGTYYIGVSLSPNKTYSATTGTGDVPGGATGAYRLYFNNLGTTSPTILRVNAGGAAYVDAGGRFYDGDSGFNGGTTANTPFAVDGTTEDPLYYSNHSGANFTYSHALANGTYQLQLRFAEPTFTAAGQRKFNVFAEGAQILNNFDIVQAAGASKKAVIETFTVTVTDGKIDLRFAGVLGNAMVSAITLVKV